MVSFKKSKFILLVLALFGTKTYCFDDHTEYKCMHDHQDHPEPEFLDIEEDYREGESHEGRTLSSYPNLRTHGYYGLLESTTSAYRNYFTNEVVPPILDYFSATLKVKYPVSGDMRVSSGNVCGFSTPSILRDGIATDYVYMVEIDYDSSSNWVASSTACILASGSKRPLIGHTKINRALMKVTSDVLLHEKNIICVMHEVVHTLGFSSMYYQYFLDSNGRRLSGHVTYAKLDGLTSTVVNVEPLTTRLREHFGCNSLRGAYMENNGDAGTDGSHFERRQFSFEFMTSGLIYEMQVSQFTLALLEGSGWYVPDYSMADPLQWGQGQGCNFLTGKCSSNNFEEFCSGSSRGCANPARGGGYCQTDSRSDNCRFIHPNVDYDCENSGGRQYARLSNVEVYGRGLDSKCFEGTLSESSSSASTTSYCFKYSCSGSGNNARLTVTLGSKSAECTRKGRVTVNGYKGFLDCPDPVEFCSNVGAKVCPRGCMGRGSCVDGVCRCHSGYKGTDCALNA